MQSLQRNLFEIMEKLPISRGYLRKSCKKISVFSTIMNILININLLSIIFHDFKYNEER